MAGYSGTPLAKKLGIKPDSSVFLVNTPEGYIELLGPLPPGVEFAASLSADIDFIQLFEAKKSELQKALKKYRNTLNASAVVWVSWPKKSSKVPTDITEDTIREVALPLGFVDIKVCAVDEVWSGLKLVVRKELRPAE